MNGDTQTLRGEILGFSSLGRRNESKVEFERVALSHLSHLYRMAIYLAKDKSEAEDLVQETYLRSFRFFNRFKRGGNVRAWLLTIQRNVFISKYRQKKKESEYIDWEGIDQSHDSLIAEKGDPETIVIYKSTVEQIKNALKRLPCEFRTAILLVDVQDLKYEEAAQVMECPVGTVRSRLSRGRRLLQVALRESKR